MSGPSSTPLLPTVIITPCTPVSSKQFPSYGSSSASPKPPSRKAKHPYPNAKFYSSYYPSRKYNPEALLPVPNTKRRRESHIPTYPLVLVIIALFLSSLYTLDTSPALRPARKALAHFVWPEHSSSSASTVGSMMSTVEIPVSDMLSVIRSESVVSEEAGESKRVGPAMSIGAWRAYLASRETMTGAGPQETLEAWDFH